MGILERLIGRLEWTPPGWGRRVGAKRLGFGLLGASVLIALVAGGLHYYRSLPVPTQVVARVAVPGVTPVVDGKLQPQPLSLHFSVESDPRFPTDTVTSVASLELLDGAVTEGIRIEPAITGEWRWVSETELKFTPAEDWPAGEDYTVYYDASLFGPNLVLAATEATFRTAAFAADIASVEFYQDPVQQDLRKVVATVTFTHPVDTESLATHVNYTMRASGAPITAPAERIEFDIRYDDVGRQAYIHSVPIELPPQENYMVLEVEEDLAPLNGPSRLKEAIAKGVLVPDVSSYFRIAGANSVIARDEDNDPVQTLTLQFTDRVATTRLQERLGAWLLPNDPVIDNRRRNNHRWQSPWQVSAGILQQSEKIELSLTPVEHASASLHSATLELPPGRSLYVKVDAGLTSDGEFVLARPWDTVVRVPDYPKEAKIAQQGAVLPLSGSHTLSFVSRGVGTLRVELGRLLDEDINHLASQSSGDIASGYFNNYQFNADNMTARTTRFIELNPEAPGKATYSSLDLSEYLPDGGFYFVNVQGWDRQNNRPLGGGDRRFILISDIGLLVKTNADSSHDVFVHSIASGKPLAGATIALLGKNGLPILTRRSSADGHAALPATNEFDREKTPTVFVVRSGRDTVFMPYARHGRMLQYSRFDVGGEYDWQQADAERLRAEVFSDRGIYRPGDDVNIAAIVKREDWSALGRLPLALRIVDARGQIALDRNLNLPDGGFFDLKFATDATSPTGNYQATLFLIDEQQRRRSIGAAAFKLEEFLPDRLRIRSRIRGQKPQGWIRPGELVAEVELRNLFGTAAQSRRVTGSMTLQPTGLSFAGFDDFVFRDPLRDADSPTQTLRQDLAETVTDDDGNAELPIDLTRYERGIYRLSVLTEGFEEGGGRSVRAVASTIVSPLDYLVGYKADGDLGFITQSGERTLDFVAVDSDGQAVALDDLTLSLYEYRYVSTLVQRPDGTLAYQSVRKESLVAEDAFAIASDGSGYTLPTGEPGQFAMVITDDDDMAFSKVDFTVAGARNLAGNLERDAELQINMGRHAVCGRRRHPPRDHGALHGRRADHDRARPGLCPQVDRKRCRDERAYDSCA